MSDPLQRGMAAFQAGRFDEAAGSFQAALDADPDDIAARSFLGQSLCRSGRPFDGLQCLREAAADLLDLARDGEDIQHALEVLQLLQQADDHVAALPLCREAVAIAPGNALAHRLRAVSASMTHQHQEALDACAQALQGLPADAMLQVLMASLELDAGRTEAGLARATALLAAVGALAPAARPLRAAFRAHKEAARALDKLGRFDEVFAHLDAAAALGAALPEYPAAAAKALLHKVRTQHADCTRERLGRWAGSAFAPQSPAPVFLVGFYRSGTTLTQAVLDAHPGVFVADEAPLLWPVQRELHRLLPGPGDTAAKLARLDQGGVQQLRHHYWQHWRGRYGTAADGRLAVDKFTMNTLDLGLVNTLFPDARVLFVLRDPRDVAISSFQQLMAPSPATTQLLSWPGTVDFYDSVMQWWQQLKPQLTLRWLEFRYEDAVSDFETTFRRVFEFLDLDWRDEVAQFHRHSSGRVITSPSRQQVAQPLYSSAVARWRHYAADLAARPAQDAVLRGWAQRLGYPMV